MDLFLSSQVNRSDWRGQIKTDPVPTFDQLATFVRRSRDPLLRIRSINRLGIPESDQGSSRFIRAGSGQVGESGSLFILPEKVPQANGLETFGVSPDSLG